jgi:hypothetical protein
VKTYTLTSADSFRHVPEFPERTAFRSGMHEFDVHYQVWPSRAAMLKTIDMQGHRAPNSSRDWIDCQTHLARRAAK